MQKNADLLAVWGTMGYFEGIRADILCLRNEMNQDYMEIQRPAVKSGSFRGCPGRELGRVSGGGLFGLLFPGIQRRHGDIARFFVWGHLGSR